MTGHARDLLRACVGNAQVFLLHYRRFGVVTDLVKPPALAGGAPLHMFSAANHFSMPPPNTNSGSLLSSGGPHMLPPTTSGGSMSTGGSQ